jgi:hypothetical protein
VTYLAPTTSTKKRKSELDQGLRKYATNK